MFLCFYKEFICITSSVDVIVLQLKKSSFVFCNKDIIYFASNGLDYTEHF